MKHTINDIPMFYSGQHTSNNGTSGYWSPEDIDKMATNLNSLGDAHRPRSGAVFEVPAKVGHTNTLIALEDTPSAGDVVRARTRDMMVEGQQVKALYGDIENVPEKIFNIYNGGGFPSVSPEIRRNYLENGPTVRALALKGMLPESLKGLKSIDVYSSLYSEEEDKGDIYIFETTDKFSEITEEILMTKEEIEALVAKTTKAAVTGFATELKTELTAKFSELTANFSENKKPPEADPALKAENDKLKKDITDRDTADRNAKVVQFGEFIGHLAEKEVGGVKLGLAPALLEEVKAVGTTLIEPGAEVVKFAEGEPVDILKAFQNVIKKVAEAKPLMFSEINDPNGDKTTAQADREAGKETAKE